MSSNDKNNLVKSLLEDLDKYEKETQKLKSNLIYELEKQEKMQSLESNYKKLTKENSVISGTNESLTECFEKMIGGDN